MTAHSTIMFLAVATCVAAESGTTASPESGRLLRQSRATVGAYYFDGWNGKSGHITEELVGAGAKRMPVWGWKADTIEIMQRQIDYAADHSIAFWAFDWYYPKGPDKKTPLNNALDLYLRASNHARLQFCLVAVNHPDYSIGPNDWGALTRIWINLFRQPTYLRVDGKPLLIIYAPWELQNAFGGVDGVRKAFASLRSEAEHAGLPGVSIAGCADGGMPLGDLARSAYTLLTGYNYNSGYQNGGTGRPFRELMQRSHRIFSQFAKYAPLPYAPVITTGWDLRPWEGSLPAEKRSTWHPDRTPQLVEEFVLMGMRWLDEHPETATKERLLLLYAWNENAEGGYLTPTEADGTAYLEAVQRAVCALPEK
jgi:hypothetical protein